jgi:hypothetical protein
MIKVSSYDNRLELIEIEFRFIKFAVNALPNTKKHKFFSDISTEQLNRLDAGLEKLPAGMMEPEEIQELKAHAQKRARKKFAPRNRQIYTETIQDGTNASELLIRVALFEAFMKDIRAEVLRASPALLAKIRPEQQVKYKHIFTESPSFQAILNQQILREIDEVDRFSFLKRAEYFEKQLNLPMADENTLKFVGEIMKVRNEISHENPFKTVSPADLIKAIKVLKLIPTRVCIKAQTVYGKNHFQ